MGHVFGFTVVVASIAVCGLIIHAATDVANRIGWFREPQWKREADFLARSIPQGRQFYGAPDDVQ